MKARFRFIAGAALVTVIGFAAITSAVIFPRAKSAPTVAGAPAQVTGAEQQRQQVQLEPISEQPFRLTKSAVGQIGFNEDASTVVLTPFTGRVTRMFGKVGDEVRAGDPLFELDSPEVVQAQTDLISAAQGVEKARSQLALTKKALDRLSGLLAARATSQREVDQARADHTSAETDLNNALGGRAAARNRLRVLVGASDSKMDQVERERTFNPHVTIFAPISGAIVSRKLGVGQLLRSDAGDQVVSISDLSTMWLKALVPESEIAAIRPGQKVEVRVTAIPDRVFNARVVAIGAGSDPQTHRVLVRSEIANPDRALRAEMFANFSIIIRDERPSPAVPAAALERDGSDVWVWVRNAAGAFEQRFVEVGAQDNDRVEIVKGVAVGEQVVSRGGIYIEPRPR